MWSGSSEQFVEPGNELQFILIIAHGVPRLLPAVPWFVHCCLELLSAIAIFSPSFAHCPSLEPFLSATAP